MLRLHCIYTTIPGHVAIHLPQHVASSTMLFGRQQQQVLVQSTRLSAAAQQCLTSPCMQALLCPAAALGGNETMFQEEEPADICCLQPHSLCGPTCRCSHLAVQLLITVQADSAELADSSLLVAAASPKTPDVAWQASSSVRERTELPYESCCRGSTAPDKTRAQHTRELPNANNADWFCLCCC